MLRSSLCDYSDAYILVKGKITITGAAASGSLWKYYRDKPNDNLTDSESFKFKMKMTGKTPAVGNEKDVEIVVPLKYLSNFWRTLGMPLINFEVNLNLTWSSNCVITNSTGTETFKITDVKLYVPLVTLSTQDNSQLLQQFKSGFKLAGINIY